MNAKKLNITDFPEQVDEASGIRIYGEQSYENAMAVLSHELQNFKNTGEYANTDKEEIIDLIREYLREKKLLKNYDEQGIAMLAESPLQSSLFDQFFSVPFPTPAVPKFTFIDLFAGIGGFRQAMQAQGGKCVFSSEWDKYSRTTYTANYGDIPFGDITQESTKRYIPKQFDILCAGFPCQPFSIAGVSKKKSLGRETGFKDKTQGTLFFDVAEIINRHRPKAFFLENVKNLVSHDKGNGFGNLINAA